MCVGEGEKGVHVRVCLSVTCNITAVFLLEEACTGILISCNM